MTIYWLEDALLDGVVRHAVRVEIADGVFTVVSADTTPTDEIRLAGLTIPGIANCHSHAFHRALRGRTQAGRGSFWTWREQMYAVARGLEPDTYLALARATYREMALAGITSVGEFHYVHHQGDGMPYTDPNEMSRALLQAATEAGIRITLLDTCYLAAGIGREPEGVQLRYSDGDADRWAKRVSALDGLGDGQRVGAAIHSVRAVPRDQMSEVAGWAEWRDAPLHVHLSEQVAENDECAAAYTMTPTELLAQTGVLGGRTSAVHATHLTGHDIALLGGTGTYADLCPTTERDLGDGIGPSRELHEAGARLTLGSDSHAVIDPFEEMRAVELDERLASQRRGHWSAEELLEAATRTGQASLGWHDAGRIAVGCRADLVTLDTRSPRTAGSGASVATAVFAASGADVVQVIADGRVIARRGDAEAVGRELAAAIGQDD